MLSPWILNFDSAPFCNNTLHLGHVRNYVLGDVRARWLRSRGINCSYRTSFDAFGLPNQFGARDAGISTDEFVTQNARAISRQMDALHLSYSGPWFLTCHPDYYRWTQWLFLQMWSAGLVYAHHQDVPYCGICEAELSSGQMVDGGCWRCGTQASSHEANAWFIRSSHYTDELSRTIGLLSRWSKRGRNLLSRATTTGRVTDTGVGNTTDWLVSRSAKWGTPLPAVSCATCELSPVAASSLPVRLPEHGGSGLAQCATCGSLQPVVDATLDCFFDDAWCFFGAADGWSPGSANPFESWRSNPPAEVHFHAGFDTAVYLPLYRFVARFLFELGYVDHPEPIDFYHGHELVTAAGRKMSKSLGNAPDLNQLLIDHGVDAVRLSVIANVNPRKPIAWSDERLQHARRLVGTYRALVEAFPRATPIPHRSDSHQCNSHIANALDRFVGEYRIGAAVDRLYTESKSRLGQSRTGADGDRIGAYELISWWQLFIPPEFATDTTRMPARHTTELIAS